MRTQSSSQQHKDLEECDLGGIQERLKEIDSKKATVPGMVVAWWSWGQIMSEQWVEAPDCWL